MLGRDETFFQIVEPDGAPAKQAGQKEKDNKGGLRLLSGE
jgi:hypothetical protein